MNAQHTCDPSERGFGRRAAGCPRCDELKAGAPARDGWQKRYFEKKNSDEQQYARTMENLRAKGLCACGSSANHLSVCTAGQW